MGDLNITLQEQCVPCKNVFCLILQILMSWWLGHSVGPIKGRQKCLILTLTPLLALAKEAGDHC